MYRNNCRNVWIIKRTEWNGNEDSADTIQNILLYKRKTIKYE